MITIIPDNINIDADCCLVRDNALCNKLPLERIELSQYVLYGGIGNLG